MFSQLHPANKRQAISLSISLAAHLVFLGWLLHAPAPTFIAPAAVARGEDGDSVTPIYFGESAGVTQQHPAPRLTWQQRVRPQKSNQLEPPPAKLEEGNKLSAALSANNRSAGSPYGSLSYGTFVGPEVRPALPFFSPDPAMPPDLSASFQGDVVIEVTIDEQGNIVQSLMLHGLDPAVDQKVLAAVQQWRFRPATRDGIAIASKQDVYYHFPR
jgi:TonB family protein